MVDKMALYNFQILIPERPEIPDFQKNISYFSIIYMFPLNIFYVNE